MNEKVFITGANGFIGSHLTAACLQRGMDVHAAVRKNSSMELFRSLVAPHDNLKIVHPEYESPGKLEETLARENYQFIVHNAGVTKTREEKVYNRINAELTRNLAEAVLKAGVRLTRFIHISSLAALGPLSYPGEGDRPSPVTAYGRSKLLSEVRLRELSGLPVTVIRPTAVYGPGEKDLLIVFRLLAKGWDLNVGTNPQKLTFVYVRDLVEAIVASMKKQLSGWLAFDISDGSEYSRYALSEAFAAASGIRSRRLHIPVDLVRWIARINESYTSFSGKYPALNKDKVKEITAENWYCDIQPARDLLGYAPRYNLTDGITETFRWYKDNRWL